MSINDGIDLNPREETIQAGWLFYIMGNVYSLIFTYFDKISVKLSLLESSSSDCDFGWFLFQNNRSGGREIRKREE